MSELSLKDLLTQLKDNNEKSASAGVSDASDILSVPTEYQANRPEVHPGQKQAGTDPQSTIKEAFDRAEQELPADLKASLDASALLQAMQAANSGILENKETNEMFYPNGNIKSAAAPGEMVAGAAEAMRGAASVAGSAVQDAAHAAASMGRSAGNVHGNISQIASIPEMQAQVAAQQAAHAAQQQAIAANAHAIAESNRRSIHSVAKQVKDHVGNFSSATGASVGEMVNAGMVQAQNMYHQGAAGAQGLFQRGMNAVRNVNPYVAGGVAGGAGLAVGVPYAMHQMSKSPSSNTQTDYSIAFQNGFNFALQQIEQNRKMASYKEEKTKEFVRPLMELAYNDNLTKLASDLESQIDAIHQQTVQYPVMQPGQVPMYFNPGQQVFPIKTN